MGGEFLLGGSHSFQGEWREITCYQHSMKGELLKSNCPLTAEAWGRRMGGGVIKIFESLKGESGKFNRDTTKPI